MYLKDVHTGVVHNTDELGYRAMLVQRERVKKEHAMCRDIDNLKHELIEIRHLLNKILTKDKQ